LNHFENYEVLMRYTVFLSILIVFTGCAITCQNVPLANINNLQEGNALITVNRVSNLLGAARSVEVTDNGVIIGKVSSGKSLSWQRPAGKMRLELVESFGAVLYPTPINITVEAGKEYNFEIFVNKDKYSSFDLKKM